MSIKLKKLLEKVKNTEFQENARIKDYSVPSILRRYKYLIEKENVALGGYHVSISKNRSNGHIIAFYEQSLFGNSLLLELHIKVIDRLQISIPRVVTNRSVGDADYYSPRDNESYGYAIQILLHFGKKLYELMERQYADFKKGISFNLPLLKDERIGFDCAGWEGFVECVEFDKGRLFPPILDPERSSTSLTYGGFAYWVEEEVIEYCKIWSKCLKYSLSKGYDYNSVNRFDFVSPETRATTNRLFKVQKEGITLSFGIENRTDGGVYLYWELLDEKSVLTLSNKRYTKAISSNIGFEEIDSFVKQSFNEAVILSLMNN